MCHLDSESPVLSPQVFSHLQRQAESVEEASKVFTQIMSVLSFEKITFNGEAPSYLSDLFLHKNAMFVHHSSFVYHLCLDS